MTLLLSIFLTLIWKLNPDPEVSGYRVYWRTSDPSEFRTGGPWLFSWDVGNTNRAEFPAVPNVFYDFVTTDYSTNGLESRFSNEIFFIQAP
jgi:hypothetical protein